MTEPTEQYLLPAGRSIVTALSSVAVDSEKIAEALTEARQQHAQLLAEVQLLCDIVATDALNNVETLVAAVPALEASCARIHSLQERVGKLRTTIVQPLAQAVKEIHQPRNIAGRAATLLRGIFQDAKKAEEKARAELVARVPVASEVGGEAIDVFQKRVEESNRRFVIAAQKQV